MAKAGQQPPVAERVATTLGPIPQFPAFRRAEPRDALELARATFLHGDRLDMGTMASQLAVSRATLYRWCGSREQLHEQILEQRAREFCAWASAEAQGEGMERVLDLLRLILDATIDAQPVRRFMEREPKLALRILTRRNAAVHRVIAETLLEAASGAQSGRLPTDLDERIDDAVHVAALLEWATIAIEETPDTAAIVATVRRLLAG